MPSLRKLAELAGVSPSTVTRALRGDACISAETRARVQALAEQYHYLPNRLMQSLMTGTSHTLGLVLPSVVTPYSARLLSGVLHTATAAGYRVLIRESFYQLALSLAAIQMFIEQRVDGILLDCGHLEAIPRKAILEMRGQGVIPIGLDATQVDDAIDHVHTDEEAMAVAAVDYLLHLGHQHIAFVGQTMGGHLVGRGDCVRRALKRRLLSTRYFIDVKEMPPYEGLPAREILAQLLALSPAPTAIIAWEDPIAAILCKEASSHGLRIPGDLSIMGFGNLAISSLLTPTLTTFEQHPEEVGEQAVGLFLTRLEGQQLALPIIPRLITIPPALIIRSSCAPPI